MANYYPRVKVNTPITYHYNIPATEQTIRDVGKNAIINIPDTYNIKQPYVRNKAMIEFCRDIRKRNVLQEKGEIPYKVGEVVAFYRVGYAGAYNVPISLCDIGTIECINEKCARIYSAPHRNAFNVNRKTILGAIAPLSPFDIGSGPHQIVRKSDKQ